MRSNAIVSLWRVLRERLYHINDDNRFVRLVYLPLLFIVGGYFLLGWPIKAGDTDLWYHLDGGRYLFTHHALPDSSYFSFLSPQRVWVNYYWLFEAIVYGIYSWAGYYGLLVLRTVLFLATMGVIVAALLRHCRPQQSYVFLAILCAFAFDILILRFTLVRPHMFTYCFIALFLYVFEHQPNLTKYLPLLAVLWCNLHGITYPILLLICGAYVVEYFVRRRHGRASPRDFQQLLLPAVCSMLAIYLTPHGFALLDVPFTPMSFTAMSIKEFARLTWGAVFSLEIHGLEPSFQTVLNLWLLLTVLALITSVVRRQVRVSHVILCLGGLLLLMRGIRFVMENVLLTVPILSATTLFAQTKQPRPRRFAPVVIAGIVMAMPVLLLKDFLTPRSRYPFSHQRLPHGIVTFLRHVAVGGSVLNDPDTGGYLRWMLFPRYTIGMDLEVPFLFPAEDLYVMQHVFWDETTFRRVITHYQPAFIAAPLDVSTFKARVSTAPQYVMVWFDDENVLYVDRRRHPDLARQYELKGVDPFTLTRQRANLIEGKTDDDPLFTAAARLVRLDPECQITNQVLAALYNRQHAYDRALPFASAILRTFPESPAGYTLQGDALHGLSADDAAMAAYQKGLKKARWADAKRIYRQMGTIYFARRQYAQAYRAFRQAIDPFSLQATAEDVYQLGVAALYAGQYKDAGAILTYLQDFRMTPADAALTQKLDAELARFHQHLAGGH